LRRSQFLLEQLIVFRRQGTRQAVGAPRNVLTTEQLTQLG
jgi:hypothetical protein